MPPRVRRLSHRHQDVRTLTLRVTPGSTSTVTHTPYTYTSFGPRPTCTRTMDSHTHLPHPTPIKCPWEGSSSRTVETQLVVLTVGSLPGGHPRRGPRGRGGVTVVSCVLSFCFLVSVRLPCLCLCDFSRPLSESPSVSTWSVRLCRVSCGSSSGYRRFVRRSCVVPPSLPLWVSLCSV